MDVFHNLAENPEKIFFGNTYDLGVDYSDPEPLVTVYAKKGQSLDIRVSPQPPGLCWLYPQPLEKHLHDPASIDCLAEDIIDYLDDEFVRAFEQFDSGEFLSIIISGGGIGLLQEFVYDEFGFIPYRAHGIYSDRLLEKQDKRLSLFPLQKEYPIDECDGIQPSHIESGIIEAMETLRKEDIDEQERGRARSFLHSEEVREYGNHYWNFHTFDSSPAPWNYYKRRYCFLDDVVSQ